MVADEGSTVDDLDDDMYDLHYLDDDLYDDIYYLEDLDDDLFEVWHE